jgi:Lipoprotein LpqB beta-propeller domain
MRRALMLVPYALLLVITLGLSACGVSATDSPHDEGDAWAGGSGPISPDPKIPPKPNAARQADELVRNFLQVAAGGGAPANERVKQYLTDDAHAKWSDPPNLASAAVSLIRVVSGPTMEAPVPGRGTRVTVQYQPVGVLGDRGRVDEPAVRETRSLTFWVGEPDEQLNLRIREIEDWPTGELLLSDLGFANYYQIQPIYFWDKGNLALVPDLRYVPLTSNATERANLRLTWLAEPSPLGSVVWNLPAGITPDPVVRTDDVTLKVGLSEAASAVAADPEAAKRLMFQLRWSLADGDTVPLIDLWIAGEQVPVEFTENEFRAARHTFSYIEEPRRYDIVDGVVSAPGQSQPPSVLAAAENTDVVSSALRRDPEVLALVRDDGSGPESLQIVTEGQSGRVDLSLPASSSLGRPSFVPDTNVVLIPTGGPEGRLMAVSVESLESSDATQNPLHGVSAAAVSPDGRRVALIAGGALYVAPLSLADGTVTVTVGNNPTPLLADQLTATAVTWTSESWLLVTGTRGADDQQALWRVTADGVRAHDLSGSLTGLHITDLTCWPSWRNSQDGETEVLAVADLGDTTGIYTFRRNAFDPVSGLTAPFFG